VAGGSRDWSDGSWNGKDPKPEEAVENAEVVENPNIFLFGGSGSSESVSEPSDSTVYA